MRALLSVLSLTRADFAAAEKLLEEAEALAERGEHEIAVGHAERAERVAIALEADFRVAANATSRLRALVERMEILGMPAEEGKKVLQSIHDKSAAGRAMEGVTVPDYEGARALAEEAASQMEIRLALFENASDVIFQAEVTLECVAEALGSRAEGALLEARERLDAARAAAHAGAYEAAATDAAEADALAAELLERRRRARDVLATVERTVAGLRGVGIPMLSVEPPLNEGKTFLDSGKFENAIEKFNEATQAAIAEGTAYRQTLDAITTAMADLAALQGEGLSAPDAVNALGRAKAHVKKAEFAAALASAREVTVAVKKFRDSRDELRVWLDETKSRLKTFRELGLAFVNDAEEMVARAEREFEDGDLDGTREDLRIAALLMTPATNDEKEERGPDRPPP